MASKEYYDREFVAKDFLSGIPACTTFEACSFEGLLLPNTIFEQIDFIDCSFIDCDFSASQWPGSGIKNCVFEGCKLIGIDFTVCQPFLFHFSAKECNLSFTQFSNCNLEKFVFINCQLQETDFGHANLKKARFNECKLTGSLFEQTHLEEADLTTAREFTIQPENNMLKGAKFSSTNLEGLLAHLPIQIE